MRFILLFLFSITAFFSNAQRQSNLIDKLVNENTTPFFDTYKQLHSSPELSTKEINTAAFLKTR